MRAMATEAALPASARSAAPALWRWPRRPRRTAAERREQTLRAEGRATQRLLRSFAALDAHRGGRTTVLGASLARLLSSAVGATGAGGGAPARRGDAEADIDMCVDALAEHFEHSAASAPLAGVRNLAVGAESEGACAPASSTAAPLSHTPGAAARIQLTAKDQQGSVAVAVSERLEPTVACVTSSSKVTPPPPAHGAYAEQVPLLLVVHSVHGHQAHYRIKIAKKATTPPTQAHCYLLSEMRAP